MSKKSRITEDDLPVELIHRIQSLLPLKEAARTCILSKSWLHAWHTIPTLRLIPPDPDKLFSTVENATNYNNLIHTTLQRYHRDNMPIESFYLRLNIRNNYLNTQDVENWIRLAVSTSCSLKELRLKFEVYRNDTPTLPSEIFSSQNLRLLNVTAAYGGRATPLLMRTNPPVISCVSLRALDLEYVVISENVFHNLLSTCTVLEKIKLFRCYGLKNVKVKNMLRLSKLDIYTVEEDDNWEINNVPSLCSFCYRTTFASGKPMPFQIDSLATVTHLCIKGVLIDNSFLDTLEAEFPVLESLTLGIAYWEHENMVITCASLKWLTLDLSHTGLVVNVQVDAPRLLSFIYSGNIPGLHFRTVPEQVKLTFDSWDNLGHSYFPKLREALNLSSKFDINIRGSNLDSVVNKNIDVDDLTRRVLFPVTNVEVKLETSLDEHEWEQSRFFDAFFLICRPSYIRSSYQVITKMMKGNTSDLKQVLFKNPHNGKWEALTSSWISLLHIFHGHLECKLNWFPQ